MNKLIIAFALFSLSSCALSTETKFTRAIDVCNASYQHAQIFDDGKSMTLDHKGTDEYSGLSFEELECILNETKTPAYITKQMYSTRAVDGMKYEKFDNIEVSWNYHPDDGLYVIMHDKGWW